MAKKQRFKDVRYNKVYWTWVNATLEEVEKAVLNPGSNWDMAFKHGYKGLKCKFQRNWILYPCYVAGKEYKKVNKL